jgi:hypothetical protein
MTGDMFEPEMIDEAALRHGFKRRGQKNWVRRTADFIQLINLQGSAWSKDVSYCNFAMWPLALGEPISMAESKFLFRTRAESLGAADPEALCKISDKLGSMTDLREALHAGAVSGLVSVRLRELLDQ